MASERNLPPLEELTDDESASLAAALAERVAPTAEASGAGGRAWKAFHDLRRDPGGLGRMSLSAVAARAGISRTPLARRGGRFRLLRRAVRDEMMIQRGGAGVDATDRGTPSRVARNAPSMEVMRRRLQVADSISAGYLARALLAEEAMLAEKTRSDRFRRELSDRDRRDEAEGREPYA